MKRHSILLASAISAGMLLGTALTVPSPEGEAVVLTNRTAFSTTGQRRTPPSKAHKLIAGDTTTAPIPDKSQRVTETGQPRAQLATTRSLSGTLVLLDVAGRSHPADNGSFRLRYWLGATQSVAEVEVRGGLWRAPHRRSDLIEVTEVIANGRPAIPVERTLDTQVGTEFTIRVRPAAHSWLTVLDRENGAPLSDLIIVPGRELSTSPGQLAQSPLQENATSPIDLETLTRHRPLGRSAVYWVCAPGFAWGRVEVDHSAGGERTLFLEPGGELILRALGTVPPGRPSLRLTRLTQGSGKHTAGSSSPPVAELFADFSQPVSVTGLNPGDYSLVVEQPGSALTPPRVLLRTDVRVERGQQQLVVEFRANESPMATVPVSGSLEIPESWQDPRQALIFRRVGVGSNAGLHGQRGLRLPLAELPLSKTGDRLWHTDKLTPGNYTWSVSGVPHEGVLTVGTLEQVQTLVIPAPAILEVSVRGDNGGLLQLGWRPRGKADNGTWAWQNLTSNLGTLRCTPGPLELAIRNCRTRQVLLETSHLAQPGVQVVELTLKVTSGISINLTEDGRDIPWDRTRHRATVTTLEGDTTLDCTDGRQALHRSGTWEVRLDTPAGFQDVFSKTVVVPAGEWVTVTVPLHR